MITKNQITELKERCKSSTQYHANVYTRLISVIMDTKCKNTNIWIKGSYVPEDNSELKKLINELEDDGFDVKVSYSPQFSQRSTYLQISWN